jgi:adenine/guanine phosphoribosyltransferase-like PRPP-binding protein
MILKRKEDDDLEGLEVNYVQKLDTHLEHLQPNFDGYNHSEYLRYCMHPLALAENLQRAVVALEGYEYDALACRGISGMSFTFPLTVMVGKPPIVVRKKHEESHGNWVEGYYAAKRYIIVDDFVGSGDTAREIIKAINAWGYNPSPKECLGVLQVTRLPKIESIRRVRKVDGGLWHLYPITYQPEPAPPPRPEPPIFEQKTAYYIKVDWAPLRLNQTSPIEFSQETISQLDLRMFQRLAATKEEPCE